MPTRRTPPGIWSAGSRASRRTPRPIRGVEAVAAARAPAGGSPRSSSPRRRAVSPAAQRPGSSARSRGAPAIGHARPRPRSGCTACTLLRRLAGETRSPRTSSPAGQTPSGACRQELGTRAAPLEGVVRSRYKKIQVTIFMAVGCLHALIVGCDGTSGIARPYPARHADAIRTVLRACPPGLSAARPTPGATAPFAALRISRKPARHSDPPQRDRVWRTLARALRRSGPRYAVASSTSSAVPKPARTSTRAIASRARASLIQLGVDRRLGPPLCPHDAGTARRYVPLPGYHWPRFNGAFWSVAYHPAGNDAEIPLTSTSGRKFWTTSHPSAG